MKVCSKCKERKPPTQFYKKGDILTSWCKFCLSEKEKIRVQNLTPEKAAIHRAKMRERKLLHSFGITSEQYEEIHRAQGGVCALCRKPETAKESKGGERRVKRLAVDHDRKCCPGDRSCGKCIRGLLCMLCNTRLGYFENLNLVESLYKYIEAEEPVS